MVSPEATDWALSALCAVRFEELPGSEAFLAVRAGLLLMGKKKCFRNKVYMVTVDVLKLKTYPNKSSG